MIDGEESQLFRVKFIGIVTVCATACHEARCEDSASKKSAGDM
jgi:hypothetical protein